MAGQRCWHRVSGSGSRDVGGRVCSHPGPRAHFSTLSAGQQECPPTTAAVSPSRVFPRGGYEGVCGAYSDVSESTHISPSRFCSREAGSGARPAPEWRGVTAPGNGAGAAAQNLRMDLKTTSPPAEERGSPTGSWLN